MKLLCSLPGIEQTLLSVLQTLTSHISESRDREGRLHQRVDDLSTQLLAPREEFCSLQKSAIVVPDKAPARSTQHQVQGDKSRTRTKPRNRPPQQGQPDPAAAANQLDPADADAGQQSGQIDVASGSAQHETVPVRTTPALSILSLCNQTARRATLSWPSSRMTVGN